MSNNSVSHPVLQLDAITHSYPQAEGRLEVLKGCDLSLSAGELIALVGPSGSGKSTLLHILGLLEPPTGGAVHLAGKNTGSLRERERSRLRRDTIGFVYQYHHLLPEFSAVENVVIPQMIAKVSKSDALERASALLDRVGLSGRENHRPAQLSGGEQQRVAIARALANKPALLLADEPTGNLDPETAESVFQLLLGLVKDEGLAALVATHNLELASRMDRVVKMNEGRLASG